MDSPKTMDIDTTNAKSNEDEEKSKVSNETVEIVVQWQWKKECYR